MNPIFSARRGETESTHPGAKRLRSLLLIAMAGLALPTTGMSMECCETGAAHACEDTTSGHNHADHGAWLGPASVMGAHAHHAGGWMIAYRLMEDSSDALERDGTPYSLMQASLDGYSKVPTSMTMRMHMLEVMYSPTDRLTLMGMIQSMEMDMTMRMTMTGGMTMGGSGHTHAHGVSGWADLPITVLYGAHADDTTSVILGCGLSVPLGSVKEKNAMGHYVHYGMQLGSGTWDALPSITMEHHWKHWTFGAQVSGVMRLEDKNASGYRRGHRGQLQAWTTWSLVDPFALTARIGYSVEGRSKGAYDPVIAVASPGDDLANLGGERVDLGLGAAFTWQFSRVQTFASAEWVKAISEELRGIQLADTSGWRLTLGMQF